ncbi:MAG TPA: carbohydrate binding domain-containing protein [Gemmatales bacterium]|nr:carbohydrate binding domain-containing protein [Gemmatales bacterium]HMP16516.1 carbohydrate binding domain-containing protein [Gemmatales bacterium]
MQRYAIAIWSMGFAALLFASTREDANLIKNPGFEEANDGKLVSWRVAGFSEGGKGTLGISNNMPHGGKQCAVTKGDAEWGTYVSNRIAVKKNQTFELKGYVRVSSGHATIKFDYFKGDEYIGMTPAENSESTDWTELSVTSDLSSYPEATHITATLVAGGGEFEAYFDDIVLTEKK